jgi:hypothetical protein
MSEHLYRKKPVEIEARMWTGSNWHEMLQWIKWEGGYDVAPVSSPDGSRLIIKTLEGHMTADMGDWIIKGVKGEFYPCKPDIFEATYEKVIDD